MITVPAAKVERVSQLEPGELVYFQHGEVSYVGLICDYRDPDPSKLVLLLGPTFPADTAYPFLLDGGMTVVSIGRDFELRLPIIPTDWTQTAPNYDCNCLLVTTEGVFFRANGGQPGRPGFVPCYVNVCTGIMEMRNGNYASPRGHVAFAKSWEILTTEAKPRTILKYPFV